MVENTFNSPAYIREEIKGEEYDKENTFILRNGKEINLWQMIQDANEDCAIYDVLNKYGTVQPIEFDAELVYGDFGNIKNLRDLKEAEKAGINLWNNLPLEIRNEFGNNRYEFLQNGEKWLKKKVAEQKATPTPTETNEVKE